MIGQINTLLMPLENILKFYQKYIGYFFLLLAFASFGFFWNDDGVKESGEKALLVLWIILWIPIFARVFGIRVFQLLLPLRKELGILMGTLAFVHAGLVIFPSPQFLLSPYFWLSDTTFFSYLAVGFFAWVVSIPLTLTSSRWMMYKMGRYWKWLHRSVYLLVILVVVHVVLIEWLKEFEGGPVFILALYFGFKILEWNGITFAKKDTKKVYPKGQKWICIPCGYIYDPLIGDADSGIKPGTEFLDIPDSWSCPVCGVKKSDFIPYEEGSDALKTEYPAKIVKKTLLNPTTLELVIETEDMLESIPGQFMSFLWHDDEGDFTRSYSIVEHLDNRYTFTIKLSENGRGARLLHDISIGASIRINGLFGKFILQNTENPKVFIVTGTGLAPVYNMILSLAPDVKKTLYFTVATKEELFYVDKLHSIPHLDLHIHTTREEVEGYTYGRVDISMIETVPETEWYLCGNPKMVEEVTAKLRARGYEKIYSEEFN